LPVSRGGTHARENLCCACPTCNLRKGTRTEEEFLKGMA
jgi:5-methylcytosine-specific restriction endonuclease McrA